MLRTRIQRAYASLCTAGPEGAALVAVHQELALIKIKYTPAGKPIITKLSPNQTDIRENARRCIEAGADALAVINTITGMAIDVEKRRPVIGNVQGGLSGPAIKPIALWKVRQVYEVAGPHGIPIIGQGGICTAEDALEFIIAGAAAVGVGREVERAVGVLLRDRRARVPPEVLGGYATIQAARAMDLDSIRKPIPPDRSMHLVTAMHDRVAE